MYSSRDEELDKLIQSFGDELSLYKQSNPLGDALFVKAKDPSKLQLLQRKLVHMTTYMMLCTAKEKLKSYSTF